VGLATIFYCLRFEISLFVASYDLQGYGGGIRSRLHAGDLRLDLGFLLYNVGMDGQRKQLSKRVYRIVTWQWAYVS
jgi:hypothetical protein